MSKCSPKTKQTFREFKYVILLQLNPCLQSSILKKLMFASRAKASAVEDEAKRVPQPEPEVKPAASSPTASRKRGRPPRLTRARSMADIFAEKSTVFSNFQFVYHFFPLSTSFTVYIHCKKYVPLNTCLYQGKLFTVYSCLFY